MRNKSLKLKIMPERREANEFKAMTRNHPFGEDLVSLRSVQQPTDQAKNIIIPEI